MSEAREIGLSRYTTAVLLFAVFAGTAGYGVALPVLPRVVENLSPAASVGWHTGILTAVYAGAPLLVAPLWGMLSDRHGRRPILLIGLGGFGVTLTLSALAPSLAWLYGVRLLNGVFAAAVLPAAQALIADLAVSDGWRARRFAWVGMASIGGLFVGPMLGGIILEAGAAGPVYLTAEQLLGLPFLLMAGVAFAGAGAVLTLDDNSGSLAERNRPRQNAVNRTTSKQLFLLAGVVATGIAAFEVGLALRGQALGMTPVQIGLMFGECSLVMFAVQAVIFSPVIAPSRTSKLISPSLVIMAGSLLLVPFAESFVAQLLIIGAVAASAGVLTPVLTYWISLGAGAAQGAELGRQAAAMSFGQALGSAGGGALFGLEGGAVLGFWLPAGLVLIASAGTVRLSRLLAPDTQ
ncbi:MFS transporter [Pseudorhizobium flavum]|uniref:MFS family permease n=1 Tax=Pseudorhizobium flavum TaxID=1335061 RepID=A0A7X0DFV9_9HYPH|nr:MFS transporter [Pseudorhizobium flavum]MBB6182526.1 MFS family permease [Pseudorhizobium flavum]CAD6630865.1 MFS transporter [Pseudorhizobium flavum]